MSTSHIFADPFENVYRFQQEALPGVMFAKTRVNVVGTQHPTHHPQHPDDLGLFLQNSFPEYPAERTGVKAELGQFLRTAAFVNNNHEADLLLQSPMFIRKCSSGGFECLWCRKEFSRAKHSSAVDCIRSHIGHKPYQCIDECSVDAQGCRQRFCTQADLRSHQKQRRRRRVE